MQLHLSIADFKNWTQSEMKGSTPAGIIQRIAYDTRKITEPNETIFFALEGSYRDGHTYIAEAYKKGIRLFVVNQHFDDQLNYKEACFFQVVSPLSALQLLAKNYRKQFHYPVIAITGSAGKTTVKEWLYHLVSDSMLVVRSPKSFNSQLGVALSLLEMGHQHKIAFIEAGISEPNEMEKLVEMIQPDYGVFTSFGSAHSEGFISKESHLNEKLSLFTSVKKTWFHQSIKLSKSIIEKINGEEIKDEDFSSFLSISPFKDVVSQHNLCISLAVAKFLSISDETLKNRIEDLPRLALRMETFEGINNTTIINDAYNMDLDALVHSLEYQLSISLGKKRIAILATDGLQPYQQEEITHIINRFRLDGVYFIHNNETPPVSEIRDCTVLIKGTRASNLQRIARLFTLKKHKTRLEINLSGVKHNIDIFRQLIPGTCKMLAMVKASSYGSGAVKIAQYLEKIGIEYLGVAYADEGVELRRNGVTLPILVMNAEEEGFDDIIKYELEPSIYSFEMLDGFIHALILNEREQYPVHLKFDTGMRRLGFEQNDINKIVSVLQAQPEIRVKSVYSHLADADNRQDASFTKEQIQRFKTICEELEPKISYPFIKHLANTEGIGSYPSAHFDMVRIGIGMYGYVSNPIIAEQLKQVISWKSVISQIKKLTVGESVGYNRQFIANEETTIAIIPVGYADGYRKSLGNGVGAVYIQGKKCNVLGNVCMDMIMVDVTNIQTRVGADVEIIGEHQTLTKLASNMNTIPYEVLTSISPRVHRVYVEE